MTTLKSSTSQTYSPPSPKLPSGVRRVAEIMPALLDRYGLKLVDVPSENQPTVVAALLDVSVASLTESLAS